MTNSNNKPKTVDKITFRLFAPYDELIVQVAEQAQITPNQLARVATMAMADQGLLSLGEKLVGVEAELRRLRRMFHPRRNNVTMEAC